MKDPQSDFFDPSAEKAGIATFESAALETGDDRELLLDYNGLPLIPQPSRFKDDPLNWPSWLKWAVLLQVSFMAMMGPFNCAVINPSLVILAKAFKIDPVKAAYNSTTAIIVGGVFAFLWMPLTSVYGRRPVILLCCALACLGSIGSASSNTFAALLGTRVLTGAGISGMMSVGNAVVNDIFFLHERGYKTGIWTWFLVNGAHVAVLFGGFLAQAAGWRWDFWLPALCDGTALLVAIFLMPETLFSRHPDFLANRDHERSYMQMLFNLKGNLIPARKLKAESFLHTVYMARYPSVSIPALYYTMGWTFVNTMPAVTIANTFNKVYKFPAGKTGLCLGISLVIGSTIAELVTGRLSDYILYQDSKRHNGIRRPEARLYLTCLTAIAMPGGLIIYGWCVQNKTHFVAPLVGVAVGGFGLQMTATCCYSYVSDCYKPQTMESGVLFNLGRGLAFVVGFFAIPYAEADGYGWAWFTFAMITLLSFVPVALLMKYGQRWRKRLGEPSFDRYI